jgi:hypothetical protein
LPVPAHIPVAVSKHPDDNAIPLLNVEVAEEERLIEPPVMVSPLAEASPPAPVESIPPAKVEVELFPRIVVVAVPPTPIELMTASPNEIVEVAVVEVAEIVRWEGVAESTSLNWWSEPEEVITNEVFCPAWVEKVCATWLSPFNVVIPDPADPEPKHIPVAVSKHPDDNAIPLLNVEVAEEERLIEPPVMVSPEEEPSPAEDIPPAKVEVAVEEELRAWS